MTYELTILTYAALLWGLQFFAYLAVSHGKMDLNWAMGPRDEDGKRPGASGRMHRALSNHTEGLVLFGIAALVVTLSGQSSSVTTGCATAYLAARLLYVPAYALGWQPWRTLIWMVGFFATMAMLIAALI
ncbi:MAPEG family protein [Shimia sp. R11_0]|uniref:MAPEG family protein n=1 Tax=Shimia sp. R11_0 TaxID=2821096 RepID=UPI001ADBF434|nr:MAPEG family protein [Shimia sp. R11_0]MBO9478363.1 MAPEG family protein [Shimia sp. R11_0]